MKRVIAALLSLALCFALCSCKSQEATNVDNLICSIGEVTLNSKDAIEQAENAANALNKMDYNQVEHIDDLKSARAIYDDLVADDLAAQNQAKTIMESIDRIKDNITLNYSPSAISAVKKLYDSSDSKTQSYVTNYSDLEQAERTLRDLMVEDAITKINAIGTVSLKSEAVISSAQKAVIALSTSEREKVSNFETLQKAAEKLRKLQQKQRKEESTKQSQSPKENTNPKADQRTINISGKQVWKVYAKSSELHFTGNFNGSGYFGIKILDSNQDFFDLVVNEIGDYIIDKTIYGLVPDEIYYIQIECTEGSWSCSWTGTYGQ